MNNKFESWKELFEHVSKGLPIIYDHSEYGISELGYQDECGRKIGFSDPLDKYSKPIEKPAPKKLYASKVAGGEIKFHSHPFTYLDRAPEYDLTYPEGEK